MLQTRLVVGGLVLAGLIGTAGSARADGPCADLPSQAALAGALAGAQAVQNGGFGLQMWGTIVNRDGVVCAVAFTGNDRGDQWPGSRVISAQKANTANAFSLSLGSTPGTSLFQTSGLALSTANLFTAVQPGGSLYGLQHSNPVDTSVAYGGNADNYGTKNDPMVGNRIGGVNVFGGGLALYAPGHVVIGGIGVSGDTSCADHDIAWRVRNRLALDHLGAAGSTPAVGGVSGDPARPDNIVYDITPNPAGGTGNSAGGFGHPKCINTGDQNALPAVRP